VYELLIGNSNVIELRELTNSVTELVDEGASVSVTLYDWADDEVEGEVWPVLMGHDTGGLYRATLAPTLELTPNLPYYGVVVAEGSGGEIGRWRVPMRARVRTSACEA